MTLFRFAFIMFYFNTRIFKYVCMQNIKILCALSYFLSHRSWYALWESFGLPLVLLWARLPSMGSPWTCDGLSHRQPDFQDVSPSSFPYDPPLPWSAAALLHFGLWLPTRTPGLTAGRLVHWPCHTRGSSLPSCLLPFPFLAFVCPGRQASCQSSAPMAPPRFPFQRHDPC